MIRLSLVVFVGLLFSQANGEFYERIGTSAAEIIASRGYRAQDFKFATPDGYKIRLTRGTNPLFNNGTSGLPNREPILFIHGILEDSGVFVINSENVKGPQDFSKLHLNKAADVAKVALSPSAKCLPFLAMDFGHEVWMMNRRGFPGSQDKVPTNHLRSNLVPERGGHDCDDDDDDYDDDDPDDYNDDYDDNKDYYDADDKSNNHHGDGLMITKSKNKLRLNVTPFLQLPKAFLLPSGKLIESLIQAFDKGFWGFSMDQQAKFDVPIAVGHVLNLTKRPKVATVTHSAGGGILLMALSLYPHLADKLAANVMWSPGFCFGKGRGIKQLLVAKEFLEKFDGPIPPTWISPPMTGYIKILCNLPFSKKELCQFFEEFMGINSPDTPMFEQFVNTQAYPTSTRELAQFLQSTSRGGRMRMYDYGPAKNKLIYQGKSEPPAYDASQITSKTLSFYTSPSDIMITPEDIKTCQSIIKVPSKFVSIPVNMTHVGYPLHKDNAKLVNIPSLKDIHDMAG